MDCRAAASIEVPAVTEMSPEQRRELEILYVLDSAWLLFPNRKLRLRGESGWTFEGPALSLDELRAAIGISSDELRAWLVPLLNTDMVGCAEHENETGESERYYILGANGEIYWIMEGRPQPDGWCEELARLDEKYSNLFHNADNAPP